MERNKNLDALKFFLAVLIVILHSHCVFTDVLEPILRCAVPCFFVISGFCLYTKDPTKQIERLSRGVRKVAWLCCWSWFFYFLFYLVVFKNLRIFTLDRITDFILFNNPIVGGHLWYIFAYLYVLIIYEYIFKFSMIKIIPIICITFLICDTLLGKYCFLLFNPTMFGIKELGNFLFVGIPQFSLGFLFAKHRDKLPKLKSSYMIILIVICVFLTYVEKGFLIQIGTNAYSTRYIGTTFLSLLLLCLAIQSNTNSELMSFFAKCGVVYSSLIYIFHPFVISVFDSLHNHLHLLSDEIWLWIIPVLVLLFTILLIQCINKTFLRRIINLV